MRFIRCARHDEEQNLCAFQYDDNVYYRSCKVISPNSELLVWYDIDFINELASHVFEVEGSFVGRPEKLIKTVMEIASVDEEYVERSLQAYPHYTDIDNLPGSGASSYYNEIVIKTECISDDEDILEKSLSTVSPVIDEENHVAGDQTIKQLRIIIENCSEDDTFLVVIEDCSEDNSVLSVDDNNKEVTKARSNDCHNLKNIHRNTQSSMRKETKRNYVHDNHDLEPDYDPGHNQTDHLDSTDITEVTTTPSETNMNDISSMGDDKDLHFDSISGHDKNAVLPIKQLKVNLVNCLEGNTLLPVTADSNSGCEPGNTTEGNRKTQFFSEAENVDGIGDENGNDFNSPHDPSDSGNNVQEYNCEDKVIKELKIEVVNCIRDNTPFSVNSDDSKCKLFHPHGTNNVLGKGPSITEHNGMKDIDGADDYNANGNSAVSENVDLDTGYINQAIKKLQVTLTNCLEDKPLLSVITNDEQGRKCTSSGCDTTGNKCKTVQLGTQEKDLNYLNNCNYVVPAYDAGLFRNGIPEYSPEGHAAKPLKVTVADCRHLSVNTNHKKAKRRRSHRLASKKYAYRMIQCEKAKRTNITDDSKDFHTDLAQNSHTNQSSTDHTTNQQKIDTMDLKDGSGLSSVNSEGREIRKCLSGKKLADPTIKELKVQVIDCTKDSIHLFPSTDKEHGRKRKSESSNVDNGFCMKLPSFTKDEYTTDVAHGVDQNFVPSHIKKYNGGHTSQAVKEFSVVLTDCFKDSSLGVNNKKALNEWLHRRDNANSTFRKTESFMENLDISYVIDRDHFRQTLCPDSLKHGNTDHSDTEDWKEESTFLSVDANHNVAVNCVSNDIAADKSIKELKVELVDFKNDNPLLSVSTNDKKHRKLKSSKCDTHYVCSRLRSYMKEANMNDVDNAIDLDPDFYPDNSESSDLKNIKANTIQELRVEVANCRDDDKLLWAMTKDKEGKECRLSGHDDTNEECRNTLSFVNIKAVNNSLDVSEDLHPDHEQDCGKVDQRIKRIQVELVDCNKDKLLSSVNTSYKEGRNFQLSSPVDGQKGRIKTRLSIRNKDLNAIKGTQGYDDTDVLSDRGKCADLYHHSSVEAIKPLKMTVTKSKENKSPPSFSTNRKEFKKCTSKRFSHGNRRTGSCARHKNLNGTSNDKNFAVDYGPNDHSNSCQDSTHIIRELK